MEELAKARRLSNPAHWDAIATFAKEQRDKDHQGHRTVEGNYDADLAAIDQRAERALIGITAGLDQLGEGAVGGLPYRIAQSRYYADTYRETVDRMRLGNIETWWSYEQFARRGVEPALRFIASVGERMERLRGRLQIIKQDILQSSIASQTEATRDNTHRLERIQIELSGLTKATEKLSEELFNQQLETANFVKKMTKIYWRVKLYLEVALIGILGGGTILALRIWMIS